MKQPFILASASPRRNQLMQQIGITPRIIPSQMEEEKRGDSPEEIVMNLSRQKAQDVAEACREGEVIIGADTVVSIGGNVLGKPEDEREAVQMLRCLQGKVHQVYTGVTILVKGREEEPVTFFEKTDVSVYPMNEAEIRRYVAGGEPMDKAGAYGIQGEFARYIQGICGDYNNVVGLPVGRLYQELKSLNMMEEKYD